MLALTQWRALHQNKMLEPLDCLHHGDPNCLYAPQEYHEDYALIFEDPRLCSDCGRFYNCLGVDPELFELQKVIRTLRARQRMQTMPVF